jgi:hypothetical protein
LGTFEWPCATISHEITAKHPYAEKIPMVIYSVNGKINDTPKLIQALVESFDLAPSALWLALIRMSIDHLSKRMKIHGTLLNPNQYAPKPASVCLYIFQ